jgi:hypothetical protein
VRQTRGSTDKRKRSLPSATERRTGCRSSSRS